MRWNWSLRENEYSSLTTLLFEERRHEKLFKWRAKRALQKSTLQAVRLQSDTLTSTASISQTQKNSWQTAEHQRKSPKKSVPTKSSIKPWKISKRAAKQKNTTRKSPISKPACSQATT